MVAPAQLPDAGPGWFKASIIAVADHAGLPLFRPGDDDARWWRQSAFSHFNSCSDEALRDEIGFTVRGIERFREVVKAGGEDAMTIKPAPPPPSPTIQTKKLYCACGRYLGESSAPSGYVILKCGGCGKWHRAEFRNPA